MRISITSVLLVAWGAGSAAADPCEVMIARAPAELRAAVESALSAETHCSVALELRAVPTERLTIALKGSSEAAQAAIFGGLSTRAADLIRDDLEILGNVRKSEIEKARTEIVEIALRLEAEGSLDLGRGEE